jgi:hypothetical protein
MSSGYEIHDTTPQQVIKVQARIDDEQCWPARSARALVLTAVGELQGFDSLKIKSSYREQGHLLDADQRTGFLFALSRTGTQGPFVCRSSNKRLRSPLQLMQALQLRQEAGRCAVPRIIQITQLTTFALYIEKSGLSTHGYIVQGHPSMFVSTTIRLEWSNHLLHGFVLHLSCCIMLQELEAAGLGAHCHCQRY